jgi:cell division septal protein FtsQ
MVKRVGANGRKNRAVRKVKIRSSFRKAIIRSGIGLTIVGTVSVVLYFAVIGSFRLKGEFDKSSLFSVKKIVVKGASHIPEKQVIEMSGLQQGMKTFDIKEKIINEKLGKNVWVQGVRLAKKFGGIISIEVIERKPIALVNNKTIQQIDSWGTLLPLTSGIVSNLPLVSGLEDTIDSHGKKVITMVDVGRLKLLLKKIENVDKRLISRISQIDMSNPENMKITMQSSTTIIEIGSSALDIQLNRLKQMEGILQGMSPAPARINLCYQNLAFVTQPVMVKSDVVLAVAD